MGVKIAGVIAAVIVLGGLLFFGIFVHKVPAGYEGVKVHLLGTESGVDAEEVPVGWRIIGINQELHLFPLFKQNYVWTADVREGSEEDESFTFQSQEGMNISADVGITYQIQKGKSDELFQQYRKGIDEITDVFLRNMVRDAIVMTASKYTVDSLYGRGKPTFLTEVENYVRTQVEPLGITIDRIYLIGNFRLPESIVNSLNAKIAAVQKAIEQENKEREEAALARIRVVKANAKKAEMEAEREALTPAVLQLKAIERWDGKLPQYMGDGPLPFLKVQ